MPQTLPSTFTPSLLHLQEMLHQFWRDDLAGSTLPLDFWKIEDDNILFDALQYLPACTFAYGGPHGTGHEYGDIASFPRGLQVALAIFELEDGMANDGWTAFGNMGEERLREVVSAYREAGLETRAAKLANLVKVFAANPEDESALEKAAGDDFPDLIDDDENTAALLAYLRNGVDEKFGHLKP